MQNQTRRGFLGSLGTMALIPFIPMTVMAPVEPPVRFGAYKHLAPPWMAFTRYTHKPHLLEVRTKTVLGKEFNSPQALGLRRRFVEGHVRIGNSVNIDLETNCIETIEIWAKV